MAVIISGKTKCSICNLVINENDDIVALPHFIGEEKDSLFNFSDRGFHKKCFLEHPLKNNIIERLKNEGFMNEDDT